MPVSARTFEALALEDPEGHWELHCGQVRRKPVMTLEHNDVATNLLFQLMQQLDRTAFKVRLNMAHVRRATESYYIPDVFVVPIDLAAPLRGRRVLEAYEAPLPLVVEVWSPSTGDYDVDSKLPEYQRRGDLEIWRLHPYEHTLKAWLRRDDGTYVETIYSGGLVQPSALPNVTIDLDALFA
jgi:Uma2 family endonuclease